VTSSSVMSVDMVGCFFTILGIVNIVRNSLTILSCSYHCDGVVPGSRVAESLDRLLKESPLGMMPVPVLVFQCKIIGQPLVGTFSRTHIVPNLGISLDLRGQRIWG
jgi:hypothetical protein